MKHFLVLLSFAILLSPLQALAQGKDLTGPKEVPVISVKNAYAYATSESQKHGVAFMTIVNRGTTDDKLISVSPAGVSEKASLHEQVSGSGTMMRAVKELPIPIGMPVSLRPGGYHVMLYDLFKPLEVNQTFGLVLNFEKAGPRTVTVIIRPSGVPPTAKIPEPTKKAPN